MSITIRYFASVREQLGCGQESVALSGITARTVGELHHWLLGRSSKHASALALDTGLRMACDQVLCTADQPLQDGCEVAFFPPVTGG